MAKLKDVVGGSGLEGVDGTLEGLQKANVLLLEKVKAILGDAGRRTTPEELVVRLWLRDLRNLALEMEDLDDLFRYQLLAKEAEESTEVVPIEEEEDYYDCDDDYEEEEEDYYDCDDDYEEEEEEEVIPCERAAASSSSRQKKQRNPDSDVGGDEVRHLHASSSPPVVDHPSFLKETSDRWKEIQARFDEIAKQKEYLNFPIISGQPSHYVDADGSSSMDRQTGSLPAGELVGRDQQKEEIVKMVIRIDVNPVVIALVGMGGIGKTTLCQHIYNDSQVRKHFDLRGWVHVGEFFDVKSVINNILSSFTDEDANYSQVSKAQEKLMKQVQGKRFLLIMDDVWCQNEGDWEKVLAPFLNNNDVKEGCKILVTTRDHQVAEAARALESIRLHRLSEEEGWSLFCKCANIGMNGNHNWDELVQVGKAIVAKCNGLPLAIKVMGSLMRNKGYDVDGWREILSSDFSDIKEGRTEILGPLYLSYLHLPSHLKACFKFFHFIPGRQFGSLQKYNAERLIDLWLAYKLIGDEGNCSFTVQGNSLLEEFQSRSFLERVPATSLEVKVHDLIFDVAEFALNKEMCITDDVRHLTIYSRNFPSHYERLLPAVEFESCSSSPISAFYPKLRLLHLNKSVQIQFHFKHLRVLFIKYSDMEMIPDSLYRLFNLKKLEFIDCRRIRRVSDLIGNLKNLRSLSFYHCRGLEMIPESVSKLTALEELTLSWCPSLVELPDGITTLANLRCLDVRGSHIKCLPDGITSLANLHSLDVDFSDIKCLPVGLSNLRKLRHLPYYPFSIFENDDGFLDRLNDLNNLNVNVKVGTLHIKVDVPYLHVEESKEVELGIINSGQFSCLDIYFSSESMEVDGGTHEKILHYLKPHSDVRALIIRRYNGARLPLWMGDGSFHQLVYIQLFDLNRCKSLSPLHQLPSLEILHIEYWDSLEKLVSEEDGGLIPVDNILDSEKKLFFPKLEYLLIGECDAMEFLPVYQLTALQKLEISMCRNFKSIEFVDPSSLLEELGDGGNLSSLLTEIELQGCPELCFSNNNNVVPPQSLKRIHMRGCTKLVDWCQSNPNSKWTDIIIQKGL